MFFVSNKLMYTYIYRANCFRWFHVYERPQKASKEKLECPNNHWKKKQKNQKKNLIIDG